MIEVFGLVIHEPDVALTDLALAVEAAVFAYLIRTRPTAGRALRFLLIALFIALAASSLLGGLFHAFFPAGTTRPVGWLMWLLVTASIGVTAAVLWCIDALLLRGDRFARRVVPLAALYLAVFLYVMAAVDNRYRTVILFYLPPLVLLTGIALVRLLRERSGDWGWLLGGLLVSFAAAAIQMLGIALHPRWFNANALYHLVQGIGMAAMFVGFRRMLAGDAGAGAGALRHSLDPPTGAPSGAAP